MHYTGGGGGGGGGCSGWSGYHRSIKVIPDLRASLSPSSAHSTASSSYSSARSSTHSQQRSPYSTLRGTLGLLLKSCMTFSIPLSHYWNTVVIAGLANGLNENFCYETHEYEKLPYAHLNTLKIMDNDISNPERSKL